MKRGLIITGGEIDIAFAGRLVQEEPYDCIISVDRGLETVRALGMTPHGAVGDFDSVSPAVLAGYRNTPGILWDVHKPEKDETDTELGIRTAMKLGCTELTILGATGGRLDHELSNIHMLKLCLDNQVKACICDPQNKVYLLKRGKTFHRQTLYGSYVSFIPLTEQVKGITLTGFKYPLNGRDISVGVEAGLCISNEVLDETAEISFDSGVLICVESRDLR